MGRTKRAVVSYYLDASDGDKIKKLKDGIADCAMELADLGVEARVIEAVLEDAMNQAELVIDEKRYSEPE